MEAVGWPIFAVFVHARVDLGLIAWSRNPVCLKFYGDLLRRLPSLLELDLTVPRVTMPNRRLTGLISYE
jgi:hypothetical protein